MGKFTDQKWIDRYLGLAREVSTWSKDPSRKIGAVAVSATGQVLSTGYNGFPKGIIDLKERYDDRPTKYRYVVHAEMNCIYNATYNGTSLYGSSMFVWGLPICSECAKGLIQVGIKNLYWKSGEESVPVSWVESFEFTKELLDEAGIFIDQVV
jgi:dCMP deaminase